MSKTDLFIEDIYLQTPLLDSSVENSAGLQGQILSAPQNRKGKGPPDDHKNPRIRTIKKYPNRRLYDTVSSAYITLQDIRQLVLDQTPFAVLDAKTLENKTRSILLQIILEEETVGAPLLSEAILENIIRFYGHSMQSFMVSYLEKNVQGFMDMQRKITETGTGKNPEFWIQFMEAQPPLMQSMMKSYVEQSQSVLVQLQEQMKMHNAHMLSAFGLK